MRGFVLIFFLPILGLAQGPQTVSKSIDVFNHYVTLYSDTEGNSLSDDKRLLLFVDKLSAKRESFKDDKSFLNHLFIKTHQHFLKHYTDYVSFSTMINKGSYNCLTGTALYALLLQYFGFDHQVMETNYHIFLIANTTGGRILLEATDPLNGFVDNEEQIEKRINAYRQNAILETSVNKTYYRFSYALYQKVSLDEMLGLLHYNLAIVAYNNHQFQTSIAQLDRALELYQSPRIEELSRIILLSVIESKLDPVSKEECIRKIQAMRKNKLMIAARATAN